MKSITAICVLMLTACGQAPSFMDGSEGSSSARRSSGSNDVISDGQGDSGQDGSGSSGSSSDATSGIPGGGGNGDGGGGSSGGSNPPGGGGTNTATSGGGSTTTPTVRPPTPTSNGHVSNPTTPSTPSTPATPASPASPTTPATPATPSTPSTPIANNPSVPGSPTFVVPGATPTEVEQIKKCVMNWGRVPFVGSVTNVKRIYAAVSVGGFGNAINDTVQTSAPTLVLIDAGVNVFGSATYNLLNQNAYYCMKVNVNVGTDFDVNLACNARLTDTSVQVNVGSTVNSGTANVGVNVGSTVNVNQMTPSRQSCPAQ